MTKEVTNYQRGPRGINLEDGTTVWLDPGETRDISGLEVKGSLPDFGKAGDQADRDADEVEALRARVAELEAQLAGGGSDKPDYERDDLGKVDITKPSTSKDMLLVIAAYEGVDVPEGDDATKAELIKAIQAKRKPA